MNDNLTLKNLIVQFSSIVNKYNAIETRPIKTAPNEEIYPSEIHIIQIIGEKTGNTITELCNILSITKGAASQTVTRLEKKGYVIKTRNPVFSKEIDLSLTEKGWLAFKFHEELHRKKDEDLLKLLSRVPPEYINNIKMIFDYMESYVDSFNNDSD